MTYSLEPILRCFSFLRGGYEVIPLGSGGGFSGAELWQIKVGSRSYCLKKWPDSYQGNTRLQFIHDVLRHVYRQGLDQVAIPVAADSGRTVVQDPFHGDATYELIEWRPGEADFERRPSAKKLVAAM